MATLEYTASIASGMMTDVVYSVIGNKRTMIARFSTPSTNSGYIRTGMPVVDLAAVSGTDNDVLTMAAATAGMGLNVYFSGHAAGYTGTIWIIGD